MIKFIKTVIFFAALFTFYITLTSETHLVKKVFASDVYQGPSIISATPVCSGTTSTININIDWVGSSTQGGPNGFALCKDLPGGIDLEHLTCPGGVTIPTNAAFNTRGPQTIVDANVIPGSSHGYTWILQDSHWDHEYKPYWEKTVFTAAPTCAPSPPTPTPTPLSCAILSAPSGLSPSGGVSPGVYNFTWAPISGASSYLLRIDDLSNGWTGACNGSGDNPGDVCANVGNNTIVPYNIQAGHNYGWWVHGVSACNGKAGPATGVSVYTINNSPPNPPVITSAVSLCSGETPYNNIAWTAPNPPGGPISGYELYRSGDAQPLQTGLFYGYNDFDISSPNVTYLYRVRSVGPGGTSVFADAYITSIACKPTNFILYNPLSVCNSTSPEMNISFSESFYSNRYEVYRNRAGIDPATGNPAIDWGEPIISNLQNTSYPDNNLPSTIAPDTGVSYVIRAVSDSHGTATNSNTVGPINTLDCNKSAISFWVWRTGETPGAAPLTPIQINSGGTVSMSFSAAHANYCDKVSQIPGINPATDPNWSGRVEGGPNPELITAVRSRRLSNPPTNQNAVYSVACTNLNLDPSIQTTLIQQDVSVVSIDRPPFIQTAGGDVHTQGKINVQTQPTPAQ